MKQSWKILGLLLILAAVTATTTQSQPLLRVIGGDTVNWGAVGAGKLRRTVQITNVGTDTLRITAVQPSCGCTTAPLERRELGPGDTTTMTIAIGVAGSGVEKKQVAIRSNDPQSPLKTLYLQAYVERDVVATPVSFPINRGARIDSAYRATVEIENVSDTTVVLSQPYLVADTSVVATAEFFMGSPVVLQSHQKHQLSIAITPKVSGLHRIEVVVPTSGGYTPKLIIPAFFISRSTALVDTPAMQSQ